MPCRSLLLYIGTITSAGRKPINKKAAVSPDKASSRLLLHLYQWLWSLILPCLRLNSRLKSGYDQRTLRTPLPAADLWIQAASVGEAYLARQLMTTLQPRLPLTILITTNTSQGYDILNRIKHETGPTVRVAVGYFPFDKPSLMQQALSAVAPRAVVLLESELWPGLMAACKAQGVKLLVVNGRMTERSLHGYLRWPAIWHDLRPHAVLAMSPADGNRFAALFGEEIVDTMANIKFDSLQSRHAPEDQTANPLHTIIDGTAKFVVLGSVRQEEEKAVSRLLCHLCSRDPRLIIGLFPRHMHRLNHWQQELSARHLPWQLRSQCRQVVPPGTIILWDTMGELTKAYDLARSVFVGGSLAPVGGQNFLEPLSSGIRPVIGPHWHNFAWVGREIVDQGLVHEALTWQETAAYLLEQAKQLPDRPRTTEALRLFIADRQGGTAKACRKIMRLLAAP